MKYHIYLKALHTKGFILNYQNSTKGENTDNYPKTLVLYLILRIGARCSGLALGAEGSIQKSASEHGA
jgi:hypothetical protein